MTNPDVRPIDGNLLLKYLATEKANANPLDYNTKATYAECMKRVEAMTVLDYEPVRHGEWISAGNGVYYCSKCDCRVPFALGHRYCPHCGVKMDGGARR